jgi:hypothetical protein
MQRHEDSLGGEVVVAVRLILLLLADQIKIQR